MTLVRSYQRICINCRTPVEHGDTCPTCDHHIFDTVYVILKKEKKETKHNKVFKHKTNIKLNFD